MTIAALILLVTNMGYTDISAGSDYGLTAKMGSTTFYCKKVDAKCTPYYAEMECYKAVEVLKGITATHEESFISYNKGTCTLWYMP